MKIKYLIPTENPKAQTENFIYLDNSLGDSIFEKYNKGISMSEDVDVFVFMHDDVTVIDKNFEKKIEIVFERFQNVAIVGVIGTTVFNANGGWWTCNRRLETIGHIIQGHPDGSENHMVEAVGFSEDVVSVDGCCFMGRADLFKKGILKFDETYEGYHFYDADICIQAKHLGYDVAVADILVKHESEGPMNETWVINKDKFVNKWIKKGYTFPLTKQSFGGYNE
jgi:hypothetical protein